MSESMQALVVTVLGERAELIEMPRPRAGDGEIVIKTWFSGVSVGTEMWIAQGKRKDYGEVPFVNGYQATGAIVEVGEGVESCAVGDVVAALVRRLSQRIRARSGGVRLQTRGRFQSRRLRDVGAAVGRSQRAQSMRRELRRFNSNYRARFDRANHRDAGAAARRVTSSLRISRRGVWKLPERHCADWTIDASTRAVAEIVREKFPDGVDVVLESTGFQGLLDDAMNCCADNGRFVFEGFYPGTVTYDFMAPHRRQVRAFYPTSIGPNASREGVLRLIERGALDLKPLLSHSVNWRESAAIYNQLFTRERDNFNGIVFDWRA